ncbi:MAG: NUDIX hydrolase [Oscillospiraceae bacterium]|nr:NUDIX hydrolase [Oscillospiraceae bacterium]
MTEYMKFLRKHIGHAPAIQCGASVIVENENGDILLQLRKDNNCWGYAGGAVEIGESTEETAKRELYEETGLIADEIELFSVFSGKELHYVYPNGDEVFNIDIVYICKKYHGTINIENDEVNNLMFFSIDNLPDKISSPVIMPIKKYIEIRTKLI